MNNNQNQNNNLTVVLAAGGTGGHVYPAIAIGEAIRRRRPGATIIFVGTRDRIERRVVPRAGFEIRFIWISGFHRRWTVKNLLFPLKLMVSLFQSLLLLRNIKPHAVMSCGGFASGPVGYVAAMLGIPLLLQEQNSYPGITTRLLAPRARRIYTAFTAAEHHLPKDKIICTGNPTRENLTVNRDRTEALEYFDFTEHRKTLLLMGGSGGARTINKAVRQNLESLHNEMELQIIWICGASYYKELKHEIDLNQFERLRLYEFIDEIEKAYAAADLVVSRAGAATCAELQLTGNAAILVPSPNVAGHHQHKNARAMVEQGAATLVEDRKLDKQLISRIRGTITEPEKLEQMQQASRALARPNAADEIVDDMLNLITDPKKHE